MPKLTRAVKEEMQFFINAQGRLQYTWKCSLCVNDCKQSFRVSKVVCSHYLDRRKNYLKCEKSSEQL